MFLGDGTGNFRGDAAGIPYEWKAPALSTTDGVLRYRARVKLGTTGHAQPHDVLNDNIDFSDDTVTLLDVNGDGLPDYVDGRGSRGSAHLAGPCLLETLGRGFESPFVVPGFRGNTLETTAWGTEQLKAIEESQKYSVHTFLNGALQVGWSREVYRSIDIDQDGLLDLVVLQAPARGHRNPWTWNPKGLGARLFVNVGDKLVPMGATAKVVAWAPALARILMSRTANSDGTWELKTDFTDLDGDGLPDAFNNDDSVANCDWDASILGYAPAVWATTPCRHRATAKACASCGGSRTGAAAK